MDYKYTVAVIVTIYNLEKYLDNCLTSLVNQTLKQIQVIMVDDGSKDNSSKIADEYAKKYKNFMVIHKKNAGLSDARNTGLKYVEAKYVTFLDGDDMLTNKACELLYKKAEETNSDIVIGRPVWNYGNNEIKAVKYLQKWFEQDLDLNFRDYYDLAIGFPVATSKLFKTSLIKGNKILFPFGITGEDVVFSVYTFHKAKRIHVIPDIIYHRTERMEQSNLSITQQANLKIVKDRLQVIKIIDKYCEDNGLPFIKMHNRKATFNYIIRTIKALPNDAEKRQAFKFIKDFIDEHFENKEEISDYINITYKQLEKIICNNANIENIMSNKKSKIKKLFKLLDF